MDESNYQKLHLDMLEKIEGLGKENRDLIGVKMKFLFDENCSASDKFLEQHPGCKNVKDLLKVGATDRAILEKVDNKEFVIVTKDIKLALDAIGEKFTVIYHHVDRDKNYFLQTAKFDSELMSEFRDFEFK